MELAHQSRDVALALHSLLRDLDPARWRDELEASARDRLGRISRAISTLVDKTWPEERQRALRDRLSEIRDILVRYAPAEGLGLAEARRAWMDFSRRCQPAYEALAASLSAQGARVPSLRPTNYVRNAYHVANALGLVLLAEFVLVTQGSRTGIAVLGFTAAWGMEISRRVSPRVNRLLMDLFAKVAHPDEAHHINSATWYTTAILLLVTLFPLDAAIAGLVVLGVGDPAAALVGKRFGRTRLADGRSLEGTAAFVVVGALGAWAALALFHPADTSTLLVRAVAAALAGAIAELLSRRVDDNLSIPIVAALAGVAVRAVGS
jgi:dolichol kinase